jgi:hypothetical protein
LSSLIREVVAQPSWRESGALVFIISGSGARNAKSYDGGRQGAPMLYVELAPSVEVTVPGRIVIALSTEL